MFVTTALALLFRITAEGASQPPCAALRANADLFYNQGRLAEAAGAYREYVVRCPCPNTDVHFTSSAVHGQIVGPGLGITEPKLLKTLSLGKDTARTVLMVLVNQDGRVIESRILKSSGDATADHLAEASIKAAQFTPATKDGVSALMWTAVSVPTSNE